MKRRSNLIAGLFAGVAMLTCSMVLWPSEDWSNKDSSQWTAEDVQRILTDSPWSKEVRVSMPRQDSDYGSEPRGGQTSGSGGGNNGGSIGGGGIGGGGMAGGIPGAGGRGGGGMGGPMDGGMGRGQRGPAGNMSAMMVTVRWESALPVRQALARQSSGEAQADDGAPKYYVISVTGLSAGRGFGNRRDEYPGDSQDPDSEGPRVGRQRGFGPEQVKQQLMSSSRLMPKGKDPISPEDVKMTTSASGQQEAFVMFPRAEQIRTEDKEVEFDTHLGPMRIEKRFRLKDMNYKGRLEL